MGRDDVKDIQKLLKGRKNKTTKSLSSMIVLDIIIGSSYHKQIILTSYFITSSMCNLFEFGNINAGYKIWINHSHCYKNKKHTEKCVNDDSLVANWNSLW